MPPSARAPVSSFHFCLVIFLICMSNAVEGQDSSKIIGAIINGDGRIGKEEKTSMEIAIRSFNSDLENKNKLLLRVMDSGGRPLQASRAAAELLKDKQVVAIVGMETWSEVKLVSEVADKVQVPILSFATPSVTQPLPSTRYPFLVKVANNDSLEMECIASIVGSYGWTKVIAIHEDGYVCDTGILTLLSESLQTAGSYIEHWVAFPKFSSLSDPEAFIEEKMLNLKKIQSRVFVMVGSSLELASCILTQAKKIGIMGTDSVWIATSSVTNLLHTVNSSDIYKMKGLIGVKTRFSDSTPSFADFAFKFRRHFQSLNPQEEKIEPGFYALRASDTISAIMSAIEKSGNNDSNATPGKQLLGNILSSSFSGLIGKIRFKESELRSSTSYEIVNVFGKSYSTLKIWSRESGFSDEIIDTTSPKANKISGTGGGTGDVLGSRIDWPGGLERVPLGWAVPSEAEPLVIGVPSTTTFEFFVKVNPGGEPTGYTIDVFKKARELLPYHLPYIFVPFRGTYDEMLYNVYIKVFDAVVGDVTILADRMKMVEFTEAYAESGLSLVVPRKKGTLLIAKPFTLQMWMVLICVILYITLVVWFLERRLNPDFRGTWANQLSIAMWFTCSTLYFAQRENVRSNFTRIVMFVWLFTVFVITASYTSTLTSMLTLQRLDPPKLTPIGCDNEFIRRYLETVLHFHPNDIVHIKSEYDYVSAFESGKIKAAILELPYQRVFLSRHKDYKEAGTILRYAGLGFVFQKGSPLAKDFSKAILKLSEDGTLNMLDQYWFSTYSSDSGTSDQSLGASNFKELFLATCVTATIMLVLNVISTYSLDRVNGVEVLTPSNLPQEAPLSALNEIDLQEIHFQDSNNQGRLLKAVTSFPGPDGRVEGFNHEFYERRCQQRIKDVTSV